MKHPNLRFAPSPTGVLHLGATRTAVFNWLQARATNGNFLLRIEDTDQARSTNESEAAIIDALNWLGLTGSSATMRQSEAIARHQEVAHQLLKEGKAYYCYAGPEEITALKAKGLRSPWRDKDIRDKDISAKDAAKAGAAIRVKGEVSGTTTLRDLVQGEISVENKTLDDMVILRADGTPTYMLAVVVDDHDMEIDLVLRGDDHLTNAFRQAQIYKAAGWKLPQFAHIPLIVGPDGAKLSKRHGALGVEHYRAAGYLPEALTAYLMRLGWGKGEEERITLAEAVKIFDIKDVGRAPARFDQDKLAAYNQAFMAEASHQRLLEELKPFMPQEVTAFPPAFIKGLAGLVERAQTLKEIIELGSFYFACPARPLQDAKAEQAIVELDQQTLAILLAAFEKADTGQAVMDGIRKLAADKEIKFAKLARPLRAILTGTMSSPSLVEVIDSLGINECKQRVQSIT